MLTWLGGAAVFFREPLSSGLESISGDIGDARLIIFFHEHWLMSVRGAASLLDPSMFYPVQGTLGYSEAFFLNQALYIPLRAIGLDQFAAFQVMLIALTATGFFGFWLLATRIFHATPFFAASGAFAFAFANAIHVKTPHSQLFAINFVPFGLYILCKCVRHFSTGCRASAIYAALFAVFLSALMITSFYIGWFCILFLICFALVFAMNDGAGVLVLFSTSKKKLAAVAGVFAAVFSISLIPFALIYRPMLADGHHRSFQEVMLYAPRASDLINMGSGNLFWSSVIARIPGYPIDRLGNGEVSLALTPILVATMIGGALALWGHRRQSGPISVTSRIAIALVVTIVALIVVTLQVDDWSMWWLIWKIVPGASAIRVIYRLQVVNALAAPLATVIILSQVKRWFASSRYHRFVDGALAGLAVLVAAEQVNVDHTAFISRSAELSFLTSIPTPPQGCQAFFIIDSSSASRPPFAYQIDAALTSHQVGIPTVNGYSGWTPRSWKLWDVRAKGYARNVEKWLELKQLLGKACALDRASRHWLDARVVLANASAAGAKKSSAYDAAGLSSVETYDVERMISFAAGGTSQQYTTDGWSVPEPWGTWTDGSIANLELRLDVSPQTNLYLVAQAVGFVTERNPTQDVDVIVNDEVVAHWSFRIREPVTMRQATIPPDIAGRKSPMQVQFRMINPISPEALDISSDDRELGLGMTELHISRTPFEPSAAR